MAGGSLLLLLDDIASVLDDVAAMTKVAAAKTSGVLGDDLALNAQQVAGVASSRELPVVWAVAKGSFVNKLILVPAALVLSAFAPWAVTPLLMVGGLYLCFEGAEKLLHKFFPAHDSGHKEPETAEPHSEAAKIRGAVRTDFILSAEIIAITLGTVAGSAFPVQVGVLAAIAVLMTVGVYGLVAGIVKLDDLGGWLSARREAPARAMGGWILAAAPYLMRGLSVLGTAAMFLVGGGIVLHGIAPLLHAVEEVAHAVESLPVLAGALPALAGGLLGLVAGGMLTRLSQLEAIFRDFLASVSRRAA